MVPRGALLQVLVVPLVHWSLPQLLLRFRTWELPRLSRSQACSQVAGVNIGVGVLINFARSLGVLGS